MAEMEYTPSQQAVINERKKNILVSAAAGSGKTAVLSERVVKKITDKATPIDVDRILVLTFTRQAAHEMKERIYQRLSELYARDPFNNNLRRQMLLLDNAKITTIDSFCAYIFKNYFQDAGVDPSLRIAEEAELAVIEEDVMRDFLDEKHEEGSGDFQKLLEYFSGDVKSKGVSLAIKQILAPASSAAWPKEYLKSLLIPYSFENVEELINSPDMAFLINYTRAILDGVVRAYDELIRSYPEEDSYNSFFREEQQCVCEIASEKDYRAIRQGFISYNESRFTLPRKGHDKREYDDEVKEKRKALKKELTKLQNDYFGKSAEEIFEELKKAGEFARILIELSAEFHERFLLEKRKKGVMDFSDCEHIALSILIDEKTKEKRDAAIELSNYFEEIMVDEYQDSNSLQETILKSLVTEDELHGNYFMVGDMKQSIYSFRHADPTIFEKKYESFSEDGKRDRLILLDKNFRSRSAVISSVNSIFQTAMKKDVGGIEYDERESLKFGASFPEDTENNITELHVLSWPKEEDERGEYLRKNDYEAQYCADIVSGILDSFSVYDRKNSKMRKALPNDIVILSRSTKGDYQELSKAFSKKGIGLSMVEKENYLESYEASVITALLSIIDNPRDDLSLVTVLKSPICSFSDEELLLIRGREKKGFFFEVFKRYLHDVEKSVKAKEFLDFFNDLRTRAQKETVRELIEYIYDRTGFLNIVCAMPNGKDRRENLQRILALCDDFERHSGKGLFNFIRFLKKQKEYLSPSGGSFEEDEASPYVRLMTIHKSKGLQFPIVILYGAGRKFLGPSAKSAVFVSPKNGLFPKAFDSERRITEKTQSELIARLKDKRDGRGEELRLLYVALTRAQEKLIVIGTATGSENKDNERMMGSSEMSFADRINCNDHLHYILPAARQRDDLFLIKRVTPSDLTEDSEEISGGEEEKEKRPSIIFAKDYMKSETVKGYIERSGFHYPHEKEIVFKAKYSVSELKSRRSDELLKDEEASSLYSEPFERVKYIPVFMGGERESARGSQRGTAFHRFLECFDFSLDDFESAYEKELLRMKEKGLISKDEEKLLDEREIKNFLKSPLSFRMHEAAKRKELFREKAFVMRTRADTIPGENGTDGYVLIQGIVDVFFFENDELVILDYKTDRVKSPDTLKKRYTTQLMLYAEALSKAYQKKVSGLYIYSFALNSEEKI